MKQQNGSPVNTTSTVTQHLSAVLWPMNFLDEQMSHHHLELKTGALPLFRQFYGVPRGYVSCESQNRQLLLFVGQ
jgi:hypothetical protein